MRDEPDARVKVPNIFAHLDPTKGVDSFRQQDGGHGGWYPLRSV